MSGPATSSTASAGTGRPEGRRSAVAGVVREVRRFDRRSVDPAAGARVAVAVAVAVAIGLGLHDPGAAASMGAGALLVGITTAVGGPRPSLPLLAVVAVTMGVSTFVGSSSGSLGWLHTALVALWCLLGGSLMALGSPTSSVGTQAIAAMIVFGHFVETPASALELAAYVVAGGGLAVATIGLSRGRVGLSDQRRAMAAACGALAALARQRQGARSGLAAATALDEAGASLDRLDRGGLEDLEALHSLLEVGRRARLELLVLDGLEQRLARLGVAGDLRVAAVAAESALGDVLEAVAAGLGPGGRSQAPPAGAVGERLVEAARRVERVDEVVPADVLGASFAEHLSALAGQVRAMADLAARSYGPRRRSPRSLSADNDPGRRVRARMALETLAAQARLSSPYARHAVRLALVVTAAEVLANRADLQHGYWVALTASVVLRPDFAVTIGRGVARVVGTCFGVGIAGLFALAIRPSDPAMVASVAVFCAVACATFQASYVAFTGFLTALVVVLIGLVTPGTLAIAGDRLVDTAVGGALALAAYGLWPSWSRADAWRSLAQLAVAQRAYLEAVLATAAGEIRLDEPTLRGRSGAARRARASAETTVARSLAEPAARRIDAAASGRVLDGLRRVSLATHALRAELRDGRPEAPVPELLSLEVGLSTALDQLVAALEARGEAAAPGVLARLERPALAQLPSGPLPPLRRAHSELVAALRDRPDGRLLLAETDEIVDAVDTAAGVLGLGPVVSPVPPGSPTPGRAAEGPSG